MILKNNDISINYNWCKKTLRLCLRGMMAGIGESLAFMLLGIWLGMVELDIYHLAAFIVFGIIVGFFYTVLLRIISIALEKFFPWSNRFILIQLIRDFVVISLVFYFFTCLFHRHLFKIFSIQRDLLYITFSVGIITIMITLLIRYYELEKDKVKVEKENHELVMLKERNRLARDVHDTLGHTMTIVLTLLEAGQLSCDKDLEIAKKYLTEAAQISREGITEFRNSIRGLVPEMVNAYKLTEALKKLATDFQTTGMMVDFSYSGLEDNLGPEQSVVIYRICQEALTNSSRHGKAKEASIILRVDSSRIQLYVFDNGRGCKSIQPGLGLTGMKQRVQELQGKISFGSDGKLGFTIHVEIPY